MNARVSAITCLLVGSAACGFAPRTASDVTGDDDAASAQLDAAGPIVGADAVPMPLDAAPQAVFCDTTDTQLVACYRFENNLTDDSSHHNNGSATETYANGKAGKAVVIGTTNGIDIADSASFDVTDLTIEAWISPAAIPTGTNRAGILDCEGQYGFFLHPNGDLICTAGGSVNAPASVQANRWTHVACTHANNTISIYADGVLITSGPATALPTGSTSGLTLGGNNPANGGSPLDGMLDQVRLFGVGRTAQQICTDAGKPNC
ncbi:MAG: LamG domain-containing protein [Deltaproteobacteria bacterium]